MAWHVAWGQRGDARGISPRRVAYLPLCLLREDEEDEGGEEDRDEEGEDEEEEGDEDTRTQNTKHKTPSSQTNHRTEPQRQYTRTHKSPPSIPLVVPPTHRTIPSPSSPHVLTVSEARTTQHSNLTHDILQQRGAPPQLPAQQNPGTTTTTTTQTHARTHDTALQQYARVSPPRYPLSSPSQNRSTMPLNLESHHTIPYHTKASWETYRDTMDDAVRCTPYPTLPYPATPCALGAPRRSPLLARGVAGAAAAAAVYCAYAARTAMQLRFVAGR